MILKEVYSAENPFTYKLTAVLEFTPKILFFNKNYFKTKFLKYRQICWTIQNCIRK